MRVSESVDLINAERAEDADGQRIGPEFVHPKKSGKHRFYQSVREQINGREKWIAVREFFGGMKQVRRDEIVRIARKFMLKYSL